jgi:hypothetical protein
MNRLRLIVLAVLTATIGLAFASKLHAQARSTTASLSGTVIDQTGGVVPQATVKLTNPENGISRQTTTGPVGEFSFALLPHGSYTLEVGAPGFMTTKQSGIVLTVGDTLNLEIKLTIGRVDEVTVHSTAPLLQTQDPNVSNNLSSKQVEEIPLNLRNVLSFVMLESSVNNQNMKQILAAGGSEDTADQDLTFLNFGGGYFGTNLFLLNGGYDTGQGWGPALFVPAVDTVAEMKVTSYTFSAQYGWSTGNAVTMVTKSGTSDFHVVLSEYMRNQKMDANLFFNNLRGIPKTPDHRNQFGVAGGGPLYIPGIYEQRNKTFFFANYEGLRLNNAGNLSVQTPTAAQEGGDFSASLTTTVLGVDCLGRNIYAGAIYNPYTARQPGGACGTQYVRDPYPGNIIPTTGVGAIDALANKLATGNYWPAPKNPGGGYNFNATASLGTSSNEWGVRVDHNFTDNTRIYGQFSNKHEGKAGTAPFYGDDIAGPGLYDPNPRMFAVLGGSHVFSPTFVLSGTLFFSRYVGGNDVQGYGFHPSTLGLPAILDSWTPQFPQIAVGGGTFGGTYYAPLGATQGAGQASYPSTNVSLSLDLNKTVKAHSLSFGYMGIQQQNNGGRIAPTTFTFSPTMTAGPDPLNPTSGTGDAFAALMAGAGAPGVGSAGSTGLNVFPAQTYYLDGGYIQDDWKVNKKLTLNLGLRYEVQPAPTARHNDQAYFDFQALNPISAAVGFPVYGQVVYNTPGNRGLWKTNWRNFGPRVGFAYAVMPKLIFRGGFGMYYARNYQNGQGPNPGYSTSTSWTSSADGITVTQPFAQVFSGGLNTVTGNALKGLTNVGQSAGAGGTPVNPYRPEPLTKRYTFGFQYALTPNDMLDVNYVGSRGKHIDISSMNYGQLDPKYLSMGSALSDSAGTNPFDSALSSLGLPAMNCPWTVAQSLMPYPEFCGTVSAVNEPVGFNTYNALQAKFTHRFRQGLIFTASYTFSKFLSDVGGAHEWGSINADTGGATIRNYYDLKADKSVDGDDIPHSVVLNYVYELPFGRGKKFGGGMNRGADVIAGGWQVSGITTVQSGFPMSIAPPGGSSATLYGGNQHVNLTGESFKSGTCGTGTPTNPYIPVGTAYCFFNPAAFAQAPAYTFGNGPRYYSNLRAPGYFNQDLAISKWFNLGERFRLQFSLQMFNAFNHPNFTIPNATVGDPTMGESSGTMGARQMQAALKLTY